MIGIISNGKRKYDIMPYLVNYIILNSNNIYLQKMQWY